MEWWAIFFKIRRVIFAAIALGSLLWAVVLAVYIAKEWTHFVLFQRVLLLSVIGVNIFTSILLYLMIVVVFKAWLDLARMLFLLLLHIGVAVLLTLYGQNFSCAIFLSTQLCKDVDLAFVVGSWTLTGLNLGYMIYLLVMIPVPRPLPQITFNPLLDSRRSSMVSVNSTTGLLQRGGSLSYSAADLERQLSQRTIEKRLFVANTTPTVSRRPSRTSETYGNIAGSIGSPLARSLSARSSSARSSRFIPASLRSGSPDLRRQASSASRRSSQAPQLSNPFWDPLSRGGTPNSVLTVIPMQSVEQGEQHWQSLTPSNPMLPPPYYMTMGSSYNLSPVDIASTALPNLHHTEAVQRSEPKSPHSLHSVSGSMHLPPAVHVRPSHDTIYRPHSAEPALPGAAMGELPNPFPSIADRAEIRRFGSLSGPSGEPYAAGQGGTYHHAARNTRNGLQEETVGQTSPRLDAPAMSDLPQWKQLVLSAATGHPPT